jgi:hypothetical protein
MAVDEIVLRNLAITSDERIPEHNLQQDYWAFGFCPSHDTLNSIWTETRCFCHRVNRLDPLENVNLSHWVQWLGLHSTFRDTRECQATCCMLASSSGDFPPRRWKSYVPPKRRFRYGPHSAISQNVETFTTAVVRSSEPTYAVAEYVACALCLRPHFVRKCAHRWSGNLILAFCLLSLLLSLQISPWCHGNFSCNHV